MEKGNESKL
jgi:magnesium-transporting ATPase (P-type)